MREILKAIFFVLGVLILAALLGLQFGCGPSNPEQHGFNNCQGPAWCVACTSYCQTNYTNGYTQGEDERRARENADATSWNQAVLNSCYGFVCDIGNDAQNYGCYNGRADGESHGAAAAEQCYNDGYYDGLHNLPRDPEFEKAKVCVFQGNTCPGSQG